MKPKFAALIASVLLFNISFSQIKEISKSPFVIGETREIFSGQLNEKRTLNIYLPEGYKSTDTTHYPTIYLLDGSADEDFIHVAGLVQFANFSWVNILPKSIVIGIGNVDRRRDFTYPTTIEQDKKDFPTTGKSESFIAFIEKELKPFIQQNYHTSPKQTIIGQSLGGLLASEILFKKPQLFTDYIIISPSLWWDHESLLKFPAEIIKPDFNNGKNIFIGFGKEGPVMEGDARELAKMLQRNKNNKVALEYFDKEDHASIMHQAVYNAFKALK
jgi:predicted alpha/beta superfamily hydrolase